MMSKTHINQKRTVLNLENTMTSAEKFVTPRESGNMSILRKVSMNSFQPRAQLQITKATKLIIYSTRLTRLLIKRNYLAFPFRFLNSHWQKPFQTNVLFFCESIAKTIQVSAG